MDKQDCNKLFEFCLKESTQEMYKDWDFQWKLLEIAKTICAKENKNVFFKHMDSMLKHFPKDSYSRSSYEREILNIKLAFLNKYDEKEDIESLLTTNNDSHDVRVLAIQYYIEQGDLVKVKKIANEGMTIAKQQGLENNDKIYSEYLLQIAQSENDNNGVKTYSRKLFLFTHDLTHYDEYKSLASKTEWEDFFKEVQSKLKGEDVMGEIYKKEKMWEKLLDFVLADDIHVLEEYEADLKKLFPDKIAQVYSKFVYKQIEDYANRKGYQKACRYLRRMKKLGAKNEVDNIVKALKEKYPKRSALMEELSNL